MLKDLIESLKGKRKLTFRNWRYQLLHWTFGINPANADESTLPQFLYTHYCPLFHLTNVLLLVSPVVLIGKITAYLCKFLTAPAKLIYGFVSKMMSNFKVSLKPPKSDKEQELESLYDNINYRLHMYKYDFSYVTPVYLYRVCQPAYHTEAEFLELATKYLAKVKVRLEEQKLIKEQRASQMVFWINLSRTVLKFVYVAVAALLVYVAVAYVLPFMWWILTTIFYVHVFDVLEAVLTILLFTAMIMVPVTIVIYVTSKLDTETFRSARNEVFGGLFTFCREIYDFVHALYENNCPPIEIVSGSDEEALDKLDV